MELTLNTILEFPLLNTHNEGKIIHLENSKKCEKRSIDFDFREKKRKREYKKIICKTKLEDLVHNLKVSPSFIESYEKFGYSFDCLLKNSFGY